MQHYEIALEKYCVTQHRYFRLAPTVTLGMRIKHEKILLYCVISDQSRDKKVLLKEYNYSTGYELFGILFSVDCVSPSLNPPPMPIGDSFIPNTIACYTPYPLPYAIYVASRNSVSSLITPYDPPKVSILNFDSTYTDTGCQR